MFVAEIRRHYFRDTERETTTLIRGGDCNHPARRVNVRNVGMVLFHW